MEKKIVLMAFASLFLFSVMVGAQFTMLVSAEPIHDVAVVDVVVISPKHEAMVGYPYVVTECYPTWVVDVRVTVKNEGGFNESFTVEAFYGNATGNYTLGMQNVTDLDPRAKTTLIFVWDVPEIPKAYPYPVYTISAAASFVSGEVDTADNTMVDGTVKVKWLGDVNGDGHVRLPDLMLFAMNIWPPPWQRDPQVDFSGDGIVGLPDLMILAMNYGKGPLD